MQKLRQMEAKPLKIIREFAGQYNINWRILYAILMCESNARGLEREQIKTRFEPHIYSGFATVKDRMMNHHAALPALDAAWIRGHTYTQLRWMSTSWGIAQIMGWHYPMLGYKTIDDMMEAYKASEELQVRSFCLFCVKYRDGKFLTALKKMDIKAISKMYNGAGYKRNNYDVKLVKNFQGIENEG